MIERIEVKPTEFLDWVRTKSGPMKYDDECNCPMSEFAKEKYGFKNPDAGVNYVHEWKDDTADAITKMIDFEDYDLFTQCIQHNKTYEQIAEELADDLAIRECRG